MASNLLLIVIAISAITICIKATLVHQSVTEELKIYQMRVSLFFATLKKECPEEVPLNGQHIKREMISHLPDNEEKASILLEHDKALLGEIMQKIIECRRRKRGKNTSTTSTTIATTATTTPTSTTIPATATTALHPECLHTTGYTKMQIDFVRYQNSSNKQATGRQCDDILGCNVYLEICVSAVGERNCSYYYLITNGIGQGSVITFTFDIGGSANPVILDLGERKWEGVNILVTVWHKNIIKKTDDVVDEFSYDAVDSPGSPARNVNLPSSVKKEPNSSLELALRTYCPSFLTTATTTPTTTTTTLPPAPPACTSAVNLTESWRRDSAGSNLMPVKGSYNYDIDRNFRDQEIRPWFRFTGAAGNRLLDKCPPANSCGTASGLWSSDPMPAAVGLEAHINVSESQDMGTYACRPHPRFSRVSVMRCSTQQHDFIYRYDDSSRFSAGFCGMI